MLDALVATLEALSTFCLLAVPWCLRASDRDFQGLPKQPVGDTCSDAEPSLTSLLGAKRCPTWGLAYLTTTDHLAGLLSGRPDSATCNLSDTLSRGRSPTVAMPTFICDAVATQCDHLDALVTPQELPDSSTPCTTRASHTVMWMYGL